MNSNLSVSYRKLIEAMTDYKLQMQQLKDRQNLIADSIIAEIEVTLNKNGERQISAEGLLVSEGPWRNLGDGSEHVDATDVKRRSLHLEQPIEEGVELVLPGSDMERILDEMLGEIEFNGVVQQKRIEGSVEGLNMSDVTLSSLVEGGENQLEEVRVKTEELTAKMGQRIKKFFIVLAAACAIGTVDSQVWSWEGLSFSKHGGSGVINTERSNRDQVEEREREVRSYWESKFKVITLEEFKNLAITDRKERSGFRVVENGVEVILYYKKGSEVGVSMPFDVVMGMLRPGTEVFEEIHTHPFNKELCGELPPDIYDQMRDQVIARLPSGPDYADTLRLLAGTVKAKRVGIKYAQKIIDSNGHFWTMEFLDDSRVLNDFERYS